MDTGKCVQSPFLRGHTYPTHRADEPHAVASRRLAPRANLREHLGVPKAELVKGRQNGSR
ncbi:hypothetical protein ENSA7_09020 [Enhygromyxa salina]|uniref:Uncharacterized protein n=1 Tax=Enhygromyxa salina TaxID=215803 RepID=A0A2S9YW96_9BACT|nr:hypothetical protein ENSA7_09020 [Enhygromyxa salina]